MKNVVHLRRFFVASLIVSFTVPLVYHTVLNYTRREYYANLTKEVCKAVEPQIQVGSFRQPIEYAQGMMLRQGFGYTPDVAFFDHGTEITPHHHSYLGEVRIDCDFAGFPNVKMSIFYEMANPLNIRYVYLYLFCIPIFFMVFVLIRMLLNRFQRQVVDVVQTQIKLLMDLETPSEKPKGVIGQLLDLNIPLLGYLKDHIDGLEGRLAEFSKKIAAQKQAEVLSDVAAQMAHDIVAPISALQEIMRSSSGDSEQDRILIHEELERLRALAEKMLRQYRGDISPEVSKPFNLTELASLISSEAKALASGRCEVASELTCDQVFTEGSKSDLSAALSNIVKNAIESIDHTHGRVVIKMERHGDEAKISVADNGCGIPKENLSRVFEKDVSFKRGGTGLGLFQASSTISSMGGAISIDSTVGRGTTVEIQLPILVDGADFTIDVGADTHLVFIDDDQLVHKVWKKLLPTGFPEDRSHFFFSGQEFQSWRIANQGVRSINFIDHDLTKDGGETGLELIDRCDCRESSILVTGRAAEEAVKNRAREMNLRLIDKSDLHRIQFRVEGTAARIVLIDDARANRIAWSAQAKRAGIPIETFESAEAFFVAEGRFGRDTPIYVDYFFHGDALGLVIAERLVKAGFSKVFLATAYPREKIQVPAGVQGVVGKEFPRNVE